MDKCACCLGCYLPLSWTLESVSDGDDLPALHAQLHYSGYSSEAERYGKRVWPFYCQSCSDMTPNMNLDIPGHCSPLIQYQVEPNVLIPYFGSFERVLCGVTLSTMWIDKMMVAGFPSRWTESSSSNGYLTATVLRKSYLETAIISGSCRWSWRSC